MRRLDSFPDADLFRRICAVNAKEPDALIFELERLVLATWDISLPPAMQPPQKSLRHLLFNSHEQIHVNCSQMGGYLSKKTLSDKNRNMLAEMLSVSVAAVGRAWEKTLWMSRAINAKRDAELD